MILLALLLAGATRCATPSACPSDGDLKSAIMASTDGEIYAAMAAEKAAHPDDVILMHAQRIERISDVYCGEPDFDDPKQIRCKLIVHYPGSRSYRVLKLAKEAEGWVIKDQMGVSQDRAKGRE